MNKSNNLQKWNQIISDWEVSDQSQITFCKERNLSIASFGYYRTKQLKSQKEDQAQPEAISRFIEAKPINPRQKSSLLNLQIENNGGIKFQLNLPGIF